MSVMSCHARFTPGICLKMPPEAWKTIEFANATTRPVGPSGVAAELHQMQPHEAEVDDFAGDVPICTRSPTRMPYFPMRKK